MSTLIERMILRTRAPLSSLEPITPVRYAPATAGQQPDEAPFTEILSAPADAPGQSLPPPHSSGGQNALGGSGPTSPHLVPPRTASPGRIMPAQPGSPAGGRDRRTAASRTEDVLDHELMPDNQRTPASLDRRDEDSAQHAAATVGPTAGALPIPVTARLRSAELAEHSAAATPRSSVGAAPAEQVARGPEITVTIGHIEVRATPAAPAARPARTAFRPEVSLTDFLNGAQESRR